MRALKFVRVGFLALASILSLSTAAADLFVAPSQDPKGTDGSKQHPFHDPYVAFRNAEAGDTIHVAAGSYYGRYNRSSWIIDRPHLTVLGGYNADFTQRTPWKTPSVFACYKDCEAMRELNLVQGVGDHTGLILDGLTFDGSGRNMYKGDPPAGVVLSSSESSLLSLASPEVTVKNCVFLNSTTGAVDMSGDASRFENNLVLNIIGLDGLSLRDPPAHNKKPYIVQSNTFAFIHDSGDPPLGVGGDHSVGIHVNSPAVIADNVFMFCGNAGISLSVDPDRVAIDRNVFYMMPHDLIIRRTGADATDITDKNLDELGDLGVKSAKDNVVADPGLAGLTAPWVNAVSRFSLLNYKQPPREAIFAWRESAHLPRDPAAPPPVKHVASTQATTRATSGPATPPPPPVAEDKGELSPQVDLSDLASIRVSSKQGAHPVDLTFQLAGATQPPAAKTYRQIDFTAFSKPDASLNNQPVELKAAVGGEQDFYTMPDVTQATHIGFFALDKAEDAQYLLYARRNSLTQRKYEECFVSPNAREAVDFYTIRGVYRITPEERPKATILVDAILPAPPTELPATKRPAGRDWFVKAGAQGGDGSREKPFRDPFQALDKAEGGDTIHVTTGDYYGKLKSGRWKIPVRNLTLLGGYNDEFTLRNPWRHLTRLALHEQEKAKHTHPGTFIDSDEPIDGFVLDGFVIDGSTINTYSKTGSLDPGVTTPTNLIDLRSGQSSIVVRNCIFVNANGSGGSIRAATGAFENNVVVNSSGWGFAIESERGPYLIRNNTFLFASDPTPRAGTGESSSYGTLLHLRGHGNVVLASNVIAFADNFGVRESIDQRYLSVDKNIFGGALFCTFTDAKYLWAHTANFTRATVVDSSLVSTDDNSLDLPRLSLDRAVADVLLNRMVKLPSRLTPDDWKPLLTAAGSSVPPPGEVAAVKAPPKDKKAAAKSDSLDDLMSDLSKLQKDDSHAAKGESEGPPYCPMYPYKKAADLAAEGDASKPGAHQIKLDVNFGGSQSEKAKITYTAVAGEKIDAIRESLADKPIELDAKEVRQTQNNVAFTAEYTKNEYDAYSVTVGDGVRTPITVLVKRDSANSKTMDKLGPVDTIHLKGLAKLIPGYRGLVIVADSVERKE